MRSERHWRSLKTLVLRTSGPRLDVGKFARGSHCVLLSRSLSQWKICKSQPRTQSHQTVCKTELNVLPSIDNLIERPACGARLKGQRVTLAYREV